MIVVLFISACNFIFCSVRDPRLPKTFRKNSCHRNATTVGTAEIFTPCLSLSIQH